MSLHVVTYKQEKSKSAYIVEFECYSKFLVEFEDASGLTARQIIAKAAAIAQQTFDKDGSLITERIGKDRSYSLTALGIDPGSANILSHPGPSKPPLKIIK